MKRCSKCGETKPLTAFYKHPQTADGFHSYCKLCFGGIGRQWNQNNRAWYRARTLRKYGLTPESYQLLVEGQDGRCAICVRPFLRIQDGHVDHDHRSNKVRGILCGSCNRAIGLFRDNPFVISEAAGYLENFAERTA